MPIQRKQRNYRKRTPEKEDEEDESVAIPESNVRLASLSVCVD